MGKRLKSYNVPLPKPQEPDSAMHKIISDMPVAERALIQNLEEQLGLKYLLCNALEQKQMKRYSIKRNKELTKVRKLLTEGQTLIFKILKKASCKPRTRATEGRPKRRRQTDGKPNEKAMNTTKFM